MTDSPDLPGYIEAIEAALNMGYCPGTTRSPTSQYDGQHCECWWDSLPCHWCGWDGGDKGDDTEWINSDYLVGDD